MSDAELAAYLRENDYPEHICRAGRAGLVARWRAFVSEVERGYRYGLEDYRNDLDVRGVLLLAGLDDDPQVRAADERFRTLLINTDLRVWESGAGDAFWDFGWPRNASGDLLRDLKSEGLS